RTARHRRRKHRLCKERGLYQLRLRKRRCDPDNRLLGKHGRPLLDGPHVTGEAELRQVLVEKRGRQLRERWHGAKKLNLLLREAKRLEEVERLLETAGDQVGARGR